MIEYSFIFDEDTTVDFRVEENSDTSAEDGFDHVPTWMELERFRCEHCAIPPDSRRTCPAALAINPVVKIFSERISHETVQVVVRYQDIKLESVTTIQRAVRSLVGLLLALSACPVLMKLRPMASFHLPFGEKEQTVFRTVGMFFIAQYLRGLEGLESRWDLDELRGLYQQIHRTNTRLADRLREASSKDAAINGLIILDAFGQDVEMNIETNLKKMKPLFWMYFEEDGRAG